MTQYELFCPYSLLQRSPPSCFWLSSAAMPEFSPVFTFLSPLPPLHLVFLMLEASEWICARNCTELWNSSLLQWYDLDEVCVQLLLASVSCFRRHQQYKRVLSCVSQYCGGFPHCSFSVICEALLLASELPTFYERLSLWAWILRRLVQWRIFLSIVWHCRALVSRKPIFVLLFFATSDICFHISRHTSSGREVVCFLVSLPNHVYPSGGLSFSRTNLVNPVHASDNDFLHPRSSNLQCVSPSIHPRVYESFW